MFMGLADVNQPTVTWASGSPFPGLAAQLPLRLNGDGVARRSLACPESPGLATGRLPSCHRMNILETLRPPCRTNGGRTVPRSAPPLNEAQLRPTRGTTCPRGVSHISPTGRWANSGSPLQYGRGQDRPCALKRVEPGSGGARASSAMSRAAGGGTTCNRPQGNPGAMCSAGRKAFAGLLAGARGMVATTVEEPAAVNAPDRSRVPSWVTMMEAQAFGPGAKGHATLGKPTCCSWYGVSTHRGARKETQEGPGGLSPLSGSVNSCGLSGERRAGRSPGRAMPLNMTFAGETTIYPQAISNPRPLAGEAFAARVAEVEPDGPRNGDQGRRAGNTSGPGRSRANG
jgi:hypothetical protein